MHKKKPCPCGSGDVYEKCCLPFHQGLLPESALVLMRSRYSAYALNLPNYIIQTTHPASPEYLEETQKWRRSISSFSMHSKFQKLEILETQENGTVASVTFTAHVLHKKEDASFTEKSFFEKIRGKWFYRMGQLIEGASPNISTLGQMKMLPLAYYGNPILRKVAKEVLEITEETKQLVEAMIETMDVCDGLGLAAPQVHYSLQIFVIRVPKEDAKGRIELGDVKVLINPKITPLNETTWKVSEGCLSIPSIHADVERPKEITIEYTNLLGKKIKEICSGWEARVMQHEYDHIHGVLFIDHLPKEERDAIDPFLKRLDQRIHDGSEL